MGKSFIIKKNIAKTSNWGGGNTTELYIYPENSEFKKLDFDFRLSTATIEVEESNFTSLPNIKRKLLLLEGNLELIHKDHHSRKIQLNEIDEFSGDWETKSIGKAVDFNFMSPRDLNEKINVLELNKNSEFTDRNLNTFSFIFVYKGKIELNDGILNAGDIWVNTNPGLFDCFVHEKSVIVHVTLDID